MTTETTPEFKTVATFWMSFCDPDKPKGQQFLGVSIVEVDELDVMLAIGNLAMAASAKAWERQCNPGGEVAMKEIHPDDLHNLNETPRFVVLSKDDLRRLGHIE